MADDLNHTMQMVRTLNKAVRDQDKKITEQADRIKELENNHITLALIIRDMTDQVESILTISNKQVTQYRELETKMVEVRKHTGLETEHERAEQNVKSFFEDNFDPEVLADTLNRMGEAIKDPPDAE